MNGYFKRYGTVIIGGGPAGTACILAACRSGRLDALLDRGIAIIEASHAIGAGRIGDYAINSDSTAHTFTDCLYNSSHPRLTALREHPVVKEVHAAGESSVPLTLVGALSALVGEALHQIISDHPNCDVFCGYSATSAEQGAGGTWRTCIIGKRGQRLELTSQNVVLATGAHQPRSRLARESVAGVNLVSRYGDKVIQSGDVLKCGGLEKLASRIANRKAPKIVVIGGSTSAVAVAHTLLHRSGFALGEAAVSLLHRRELRIYYQSVAEALAEQYSEFGPDDLCPLTGRVFRLAGLRLDSRELIMQARGIGGRAPEPRLRLHRLKKYDPEAVRMMDEADVIIAALGYRPKALNILKEKRGKIRLFADTAFNAPLVDEKCRVMDVQSQPIDGLFGIGLAAGFVPSGALGGEPSFSGQANGLWLWQTAVGSMIIDNLLARPVLPAASRLSKITYAAAAEIDFIPDAFSEVPYAHSTYQASPAQIERSIADVEGNRVAGHL